MLLKLIVVRLTSLRLHDEKYITSVYLMQVSFSYLTSEYHLWQHICHFTKLLPVSYFITLWRKSMTLIERHTSAILVHTCSTIMHSLHIRITVCLLELTLHYLKLSRLQITNFPLFMPTHHNILIIRLTKRTTLHCSSPANTHPTCTMLVHKAHACAETRCTPPPLCLSPSLCRCIFICFRRQHVRPPALPNGFVEGQPIALQSWIRQLTSYSQPHRGSYRVRHYSNTT